MATRQPENSMLVEDCLSKCFEPISGDRRSMTNKMKFDVSGEEEESCASNDASIGFDALSITEQTANDGYRPIRNKQRASRSVSRCKTVPTYQFTTQPTKVKAPQFSFPLNKTIAGLVQYHLIGCVWLIFCIKKFKCPGADGVLFTVN